MTTHAVAKFEVKSWDEKTWDGKNWKEIEGEKLTHAIVTKTYQGDIEGTGTSQSLTTYNDKGFASYTGLEKIEGTLAGKKGSFVLQTSGTYDPTSGEAKAEWFVAPDSGTGALKGLRGKGGFVANHGNPNVNITLDYDLD